MRQGGEVVLRGLLRGDSHRPLECDEQRIAEQDGPQAPDTDDQRGQAVSLGADREVQEQENCGPPAEEHEQGRSPLGGPRPDLVDGRPGGCDHPASSGNGRRLWVVGPRAGGVPGPPGHRRARTPRWDLDGSARLRAGRTRGRAVLEQPFRGGSIRFVGLTGSWLSACPSRMVLQNRRPRSAHRHRRANSPSLPAKIVASDPVQGSFVASEQEVRQELARSANALGAASFLPGHDRPSVAVPERPRRDGVRAPGSRAGARWAGNRPTREGCP